MGIEIQNIVIQSPANSALHGSLSTPQASDSLSLTRSAPIAQGVAQDRARYLLTMLRARTFM